MSAERVTDMSEARRRRELQEQRVRMSVDYEMGKPAEKPFFDIKPRFNPAELSLTAIILSMWTVTLVVCTIILVMSR